MSTNAGICKSWTASAHQRHCTQLGRRQGRQESPSLNIRVSHSQTSTVGDKFAHRPLCGRYSQWRRDRHRDASNVWKGVSNEDWPNSPDDS